MTERTEVLILTCPHDSDVMPELFWFYRIIKSYVQVILNTLLRVRIISRMRIYHSRAFLFDPNWSFYKTLLRDFTFFKSQIAKKNSEGVLTFLYFILFFYITENISLLFLILEIQTVIICYSVTILYIHIFGIISFLFYL